MWVTQMFAPKWPWVAGHRKGKEKMKPNDWRGTPKRKWGSLPLNGSKYKKREFLSKSRGRRTIAILLRAKDKKTETWETWVSQASIKNSTKSISPWKKRNSPVEPRQKNKISNFGTFFRYTQILLPLSLSQFEKG